MVTCAVNRAFSSNNFRQSSGGGWTPQRMDSLLGRLQPRGVFCISQLLSPGTVKKRCKDRNPIALPFPSTQLPRLHRPNRYPTRSRPSRSWCHVSSTRRSAHTFSPSSSPTHVWCEMGSEMLHLSIQRHATPSPQASPVPTCPSCTSPPYRYLSLARGMEKKPSG